MLNAARELELATALFVLNPSSDHASILLLLLITASSTHTAFRLLTRVLPQLACVWRHRCEAFLPRVPRRVRSAFLARATDPGRPRLGQEQRTSPLNVARALTSLPPPLPTHSLTSCPSPSAAAIPSSLRPSAFTGSDKEGRKPPPGIRRAAAPSVAPSPCCTSPRGAPFAGLPPSIACLPTPITTLVYRQQYHSRTPPHRLLIACYPPHPHPHGFSACRR